MTDKIDQTYFSIGQRILMLLFNCIPFLHVAGTVVAILLPWHDLWQRIAAGFIFLYLAPPIAARLTKSMLNIKEGKLSLGSKDFFTWWALSNVQMLFCRLPILEELLRLIPGLYTLWLRLWGAKIGRLTYWGAGTMILDRQFIDIGNYVVLGAGVRLNPHVIALNEKGSMELLLATVKIGDNSVVGGYSLLTAGTEIAEGECTRAMLASPPFIKWAGGKRTDKGSQDQQ